MPRKIDFITALYKETVKNLTKDTASWRAFLHSAAFQYKYPFADQVLIHAQRPFATACTELEVWNKHFGRWVNRGAKGIALIREKGGRSYLEHVFDVGDTHHLDNVPFELWQVKKGYETEIAEALENRFGDVGSKADFANAVATACANLVQENIQDYVREIYDSVEGSFLDDLDDDNLRYRLMLTTQASVTYAVLTRLGLEEETDVHAPAEAFGWIHEFNTPATINILGTATGDMTEICLREIERTVKFLDKENRTFDKTEENRYNDGGKTNDVKNGGERNDIDLQNGGERVTVPESNPARTDDDRNARQVRADEVGVFEEAPQGNVHDTSDRSEVDGALDRGGESREGTDLGEYIPDGTEPWGNGEAESGEPDGVGSDDELDQALSRGRSADIPNQRITDSNLPTIADPDSLIQILRHGDFLHKSKDEIVSFLRSDALTTEKAEYIKSAYTPFAFIEFNKKGTGEHIGYRADADSLLVYEGNFPSRKSEMRLEWDFVAKLIGALIKDRNYLDEPKEGQQLSLMDVENGVEPTAEEPKPTAKQFGISQEVIDDLLRLGGCTRNSNMRIYEFYRRAKGSDETIAFLRREYETDFVGITVDGKNYAAKWDDNGIRFSTGERVSEYSSALIPWESVDKRIRELMNLGQYLSKDEQEKAKDVWEDYISGNVRSLLYDSFENIPEERKFWLNKSLATHESVKLFEQKLHDPEKGEMLVKQARECVPLLEEYPPRFRYARNTDDKIFFIEMQLREPIDFPEADPYIMPPKQFVTQDFFDNALLSVGSQNRLKYYSFFLRERDLAKRAKYIQDSFGTGGSMLGRFADNHDAKGWLIYGGLQNSSMGMHLKWSQVAKRMDEFIRKGKYLTDEDKAQMDSYERHEVAYKIKRFFITKPPEIVQPLGDKRNDDFLGAVDEISKQIESKDRLLEIVALMQQTFENEQPGQREYENDKELLEDVKGYSEGTFNLFPHSPYRKKTPFAPEKKVVEQEPTPVVEKPAEKEMPEIEYDLHLGVTVHIGKDECDILSLSGDTVELFDGTLIPLEMDFDTFMKRIRENPLNDHLLKEPKPARAEYKEEQPKAETPKKTRQSKKNQVTVESIVRQIEDSYNTWDAYMNGGGSDPNWEDGCNMNLVRNHIIYYRQQLLGMCSEDNLPEIFNRELPPKMSSNFMAQPDRIREEAQRALEVYKSNETYQWCKAQAARIPEKMLKKTTIQNILGYVSGLEHAIENDELVAMRRHRNPERYLDSFDRCKEEIEKILPQIEQDQRTDDIFAALMNEGEDAQNKVTEGVERLSIPQKTDIWERYTLTKTHYPDHLALIRVGDFYELFEQDAVEASSTLELTLTGRDVKGKPTRVPMCGFPYHTTDKFVQKLLDKGFKVAVAEEDKTLPIKETTQANKTYTDAEIADILPKKGQDILRLYEYRFSDDRFYVDAEKGTVTWLYFNPDSTSKGQFIENVVTFEEIAALKENEDFEVFFDKLGSEAEQFITDCFDEEFRDTAYHFLTDEYTFRGYGSEAMEQLVSIVENYKQAERTELSNRFSIRRMPYEGGRVAIWDDEIQKYVGGNGQLYLFADQNDAVEHLAKLQRENGMAEVAIFTTPNGKAYHIGDTLFVSFEDNNGVHIEIERMDVDYVWYTMPSEPGQEAVNIDREDFEKYLDAGNISVLFSKYLAPDRTPGEIEADKAEEAELTAVSRFLHATRMEDIDLYFDMGEIVAKDSSNEWRGKAFYEFLLNEAIALDENLDPVEGISINDETLNPVIELAEKYGANIVRVGAESRENDSQQTVPMNDENAEDFIFAKFEQCKELYPRRITMIQYGNNYYFVGKDAEKAAKILKTEITDTYSVNGEDISVLVVPLLDYSHTLFKLHDAGAFLVQADKDSIYPIDKFIKGYRVDSGLDISFEVEQSILKEYDIEDAVFIDEDGYFNSSKARFVETERALEKAKGCITRFCAEEYRSDTVDFSDLSNIGIAYTTITSKEIPVKAIVNLRDYRIERFLDDKLIETREYESLQELTEDELQHLTFDDLTYVSEGALEEYRQKAEKEFPKFIAEPEKPKRVLPVYNSHPEIPDSEKHNYRITDDNLGVGGAKEKFKRNMAAINLLHELEFENRLATPEEQEILAQYTGWGGLSDAFDESRDNWASEFKELYATLSPEEYNDARASTLTAFYTPPVVIRAMYDALERMGLKRGNLLEPSCGTGNFMGMLPESMENCKIYGVELDSISGRIARQLYQKNGITINGYEKTHLPDSFFDVAIGNVPFGHYKLVDKKYDKHNFLIHDYFFAKTLDKVRPGGVIAFVTSSGTLDKENPAVRKYLAQRADLIGAIRLPDTAFKDNAGTRVVSDIIFLQKRDRILDTEPDWVHLGYDENGIPMNQYFIDNPDMVLGEMVMRSGPFGDEPTCRAYEGQDLGEALKEAVANINAEIEEVEVEELTGEGEKTLPADPNVKNFSYTLVDGKVYYRQNSIMSPVETTVTGENRIKGMIAIRDTVRELIDAQLDDAPDSEIKSIQARLNEQYDAFTKKYGLINSRGNSLAFSDDNSYFLLCSLEILDDNKELKAKADMFTKRTIKPQTVIDKVDTASEALAVSISERAMVDMEYMSELTGKSEEELYADLKGVIFLNPKHSHMLGHRKYLMADEYLSGNVREKLAFARRSAEEFSSEYDINVEALEKVQPKDLTASEIGVKLGSVWIPPEDIHDFIHELLGNSYYVRRLVEVKFIPHTAQWVLTNKSKDKGNVKANSVYGTKAINAYEIIEETLNLKDVRIYDYVVDENGNKKAVLNKKETTIAQGKQEQIKRAFEEWIWKDPERRERLCKLYNEKFNSVRPREYDGSHIKYYGMNPEIKLRKHQSDAVARIMYGGNSLLAHVVGAGKTFTMVAAAQESKRLGLCNKSMFVVPNHLIEQWATEYLQLYPSANILVATKKDFETKNRKKFCARIATGDYDAVIIGHSQFEKIPVSVERQIRTIETEIQEIMLSLSELQYKKGERVTVKQLERAKKSLEAKLEKLNDQTRKDDVVTFEELGVDRLFVDEAHFYKNLAAYSKMRNVAGISQTEAQKSSDLYMKCRYLDELTGGKGCVFATGTPISNTMVELYTMQKYLQYDELKQRGLLHFDAWASTFGETVTAIELAPDGTGYRAKTRFAKFFNIPELMATFKQVADIQTADMLNLPTPEAHFHVVKVEASEMQKEMVQSFAKRAEKIHNGSVKSDEDNMLLVTNDGRKAALDQRLLNPMLEDFEGSKVNNCVQKVYEIWEKNKDKKSAQLVFCDLSTPKNDGSFNVYDDIRNKLIAMGIPSEEIAFIHTADTDTKKKELFGKVRRGQVRVLMGSTFKMGAGTNVQERLIALHDLDVPWRPSDLEQRAGRIVRQGNTNPEVDLYRYVTEGTFDAYSYQLLESKQKFISQIMTSKSPVRIAEDVDETALSYAEIKALASGNPKIMEKMQLDTDVQKLKLQKAFHLSQRYSLEDALIKKFPQKIAEVEERIKGIAEDISLAEENTKPNENGFSPMIVMGTTYTEKADAGKAILSVCERMQNPEPRALGEYRGFRTEIGFEGSDREFYITLKGTFSHKVGLGDDPNGIITRLDNAIAKLTERKENLEYELGELHKQVENAKAEIEKPFVDEAILQEKCRRLDELNAELNMDKRENEIVDGAEEQSTDDQDRSRSSRDNRDDDAR